MTTPRQPILNHPNDGRIYKLGAAENTQVIFKADGEEVANQYAITEWWMDQSAPSPAPHVHEHNDELIYVLAGPVMVLIGEEWTQMEKGGLAVIPAGTKHTFRNDSDQRVGILNLLMSGAYEAMMPQIQMMFANQ